MYLTPNELGESVHLNIVLRRNRTIRKFVGILTVLMRVLVVISCIVHFAVFHNRSLFGLLFTIIIWLFVEVVYQYTRSHLVIGVVGFKHQNYTFLLDDFGKLMISDDTLQMGYQLTLKQYEDLATEIEQIVSQYKHPKMKILSLCLNDFLASKEQNENVPI